MKEVPINRITTVLFALIVIVGAHAQWVQLPSTGSEPEHLEDRTELAGQSGLAPFIKAELVDEKANARQRRAVVKVETEGVILAAAGSAPNLTRAQIEYRVDGGEPVRSTSRQMTFPNLSPGEHRVEVALVDNEGEPLAEHVTLKVYIPE